MKSADILASFLVDGFAAGTWRAELKRGTATLTLSVLRKIAAADRRALDEEGVRLLRWIEPDTGSYEVRFAEGQ